MTKKTWQIVDGGGVKASLLWDEDTDAWTYYSNGPQSRETALYRTIPVLYRGVQIIADSVCKVPFALYRGDNEVDNSASWDNIIGYLPKPRRTLRLISQALDRHGRAYLLKVRNRGGVVKGLKWFEPTSIEPRYARDTGELIGFVRQFGATQIEYMPEDIVYFWLEDPDVEIGPPLSFPIRAALQSAGVLHNLDEFVNAYFKHGAVRPMIVSAKGIPPPEERERIKTFLQRMVNGLRNAFKVEVFSADNLDFTQIGDGLDQLQNQELTDDQRHDIALALGIPQTILFANSANYATSQSDWLNFHETTIIPRCELIAETLNEQLFKPDGLEMQFRPEGLDIYREDESKRASALGQLTGAGVPLLMAMELLGYDLTPEQRAELEAEVVEKEERAEQMREQTQPAEQPESAEPEEETEDVKTELKHWRRLANKAMREGKPLPADFVPDHIPPARAAQIASALRQATTGADIKAAFEQPAPIPLPAEWPISAELLAELRRANDLLEAVTK